MINSFKLLLPLSLNNSNSTYGLDESIIDVNETSSNFTGSNLINSNQTVPWNLTAAVGEENLTLNL